MATRRVTIEFNAFPNFATYQGLQDEANWYAQVITQDLRAAGWSVINCTGTALAGFVHIVLNINLENSFDALSTGTSYLPSALAADFTISGQSITDSALANQVNQTQQIPHMPSTQATFVGVSNGYNIYKDAQGCFYYDNYIGDGLVPIPANCPSKGVGGVSDWLTSIGATFGFGSGTGLGKTGIEAAAGGAVILFIAFLLINKNK
jgi:hypothetical protein